MDCTLKHSLISKIMGKEAEYPDFDKGQNTMAPRLETAICERAHLVGYSRAINVSAYRKLCVEDETTSLW